jgi:2-polyprenyl-6-methoxyphenol hydroxylase-like FAD-dependent oxidoreductase
VLWNTRCVAVSNPDASIASIENNDATQQDLGADYVICADGAHSIVRNAVGANFKGESEPETFSFVDAILDRPIDPA